MVLFRQDSLIAAAEAVQAAVALAERKAQMASMTRAEFDALPDYSCSLPTGTAIGEQWKRGEPYGAAERWYRGEYIEHHEPGRVGIEWREIHIEDDHA